LEVRFVAAACSQNFGVINLAPGKKENQKLSDEVENPSPRLVITLST
jgi:hypothetical protein